MPTLWDLFGLFPACAGVILSSMASRISSVAFPRLCGGDPLVDGLQNLIGGFSPPVRG